MSYDVSNHDPNVVPSCFLPDFNSVDEALKQDEWWLHLNGYVTKLDGFNKEKPFVCYPYPKGVVIPSINFLTKFRQSTQDLCTASLNENDNGNSGYELSSNKYWELIQLEVNTKQGTKLIDSWIMSDAFIKLFKKDLIKVSYIDSFDDKYFDPSWLNNIASDVSSHIKLVAYHSARNNRIQSSASQRNLRNHISLQIAGFINELSFMNANYWWFKDKDADAVATKFKVIHNESKYLDLIG